MSNGAPPQSEYWGAGSPPTPLPAPTPLTGLLLVCCVFERMVCAGHRLQCKNTTLNFTNHNFSLMQNGMCKGTLKSTVVPVLLPVDHVMSVPPGEGDGGIIQSQHVQARTAVHELDGLPVINQVPVQVEHLQ